MSSQKITDPLLECLVIFTKLHNKPYSAEALTEGLPVSGGTSTIELFSTEGSKALFSRAAKRAGFTSSLVQKPLEDISPLVLPCILILKGRKACILEKFDEQNNKVKIISPEMNSGENWVDYDILNEQYIGYCFYLKKEFVSEDRTKTYLIDKEKSHWFWGTLRRSSDIYKDVIIASIVINLFVLASPLFTMNVYDRVVPNNATDTLWVLAIGIVVIYIIDMFLKLTEEFEGNTLYFYDLNAKFNYKFSEKDQIFVSGYFGRDVLGLDDRFGIDWGNITATVRYNHLFNGKLFSNTSLIYSNYDYDIEIQNNADPFSILSQVQDFNIKQEFQYYPNNNNKWKFGINAIFHTGK
jgi:hypothetical protein